MLSLVALRDRAPGGDAPARSAPCAGSNATCRGSGGGGSSSSTLPAAPVGCADERVCFNSFETDAPVSAQEDKKIPRKIPNCKKK